MVHILELAVIMKVILIMLLVSGLFSCLQSKSVNKMSELEKDTAIIDSLNIESSNDNEISVYSYPNLTAWGGLTLIYEKNNLKTIEAKQSAELGFRKRVYCIKNYEIERIEYVIYQANWGAYEEQYGKEDFDETKMTYLEREIVYNKQEIQTSKTDELTELLDTGNQILSFIKTEKLDCKIR